jgi:CheY-like chemotaxis protein
MPGLSGWELLRRLRPINPQLPGIVCSGHGTPPESAARELPGVLFLPKPVSRRTLAQALARLLA